MSRKKGKALEYNKKQKHITLATFYINTVIARQYIYHSILVLSVVQKINEYIEDNENQRLHC